jgi:hypothetical protein
MQLAPTPTTIGIVVVAFVAATHAVRQSPQHLAVRQAEFRDFGRHNPLQSQIQIYIQLVKSPTQTDRE